jgi:hypothetical protein
VECRLKKEVGCVRGGRETRDVGASVAGCEGGRLGKRRVLTGWGPRASERELANRRSALT